MTIPEPTEDSRLSLSVTVFGIVNAGKSSLINALTHQESRPTGPIGGTTREVVALDWREAISEDSGRPFVIRFVDTPGLEEVEGEALGDLALEAAKASDLVLFVLAEDLTETSLNALNALRTVGKPMLVALNKVDLLGSKELEEILSSVRLRLSEIVAEADVLPVAAAPLVHEKVEQSDGTFRTILKRDAPQVAVLEARLVSALVESAEDLRSLANASRSVEALIATREPLKAERRKLAERVADESSVALALAMAVNPLPLVDFLTGPGGLAILVTRVAHAYGESPTRESVSGLVKELLKGGRNVFWGSLLGIFAGGAMKLLPGLGHLTGAITQGASAGYVGHVLGRALVDYHENGHDWGEGGLIADLHRIAASTDRKSLTKGLVDRLKTRLGA